MKSKITAILLTLFLGGIGIHKFYLGQSFKGLLYLFFCWTFIPSILAFIDFTVLLLMSQNSFDIKYNNY
ncbi:TM2 domain-containing protein [Flavobacterium oreochromis]|uniref:TM2 domain-containing protein n=1 Tax=Flavobacterium oreochromis TaxID=2906078 RepID=A0ABW8P5A7_9FLAO